MTDMAITLLVSMLRPPIMPDFIGRRLGAYLPQATIDQAWSRLLDRFWLHTSTFDHPKGALRLSASRLCGLCSALPAARAVPINRGRVI
jgi:hypothetical protein